MQHGPSTGMSHRSLVLLCWLSWGCPAESWAELWLPACRLCHTCLINPPERVQMLSWLLFYCSFSFQPTKIFNYMKWKKTCDSLFMIFSAVFLISRLVIYPYTWVCCSEGTWKSCFLRDMMISGCCSLCFLVVEHMFLPFAQAQVPHGCCTCLGVNGCSALEFIEQSWSPEGCCRGGALGQWLCIVSFGWGTDSSTCDR